MADNLLGEELFKIGWQQGVLLPALPWSVIYQVDDPLNKISKAAQRQGTIDTRQGNLSAITTPPRYAVAFGINRQSDYLVIASQDCDITSKLSDEPNVIAMRAFFTSNENILRYAGSNSTQYFLLDHERGLVAQSTLMVLIEKPVLTLFTPQSGAQDRHTKERFARWVARHFDRPAIDENVVGAVIKPLLENLSQMQKDNDPDLEALKSVGEVRLARIVGSPPFDVRLLFIISEAGFPDNGVALTRLVSRIFTWLNPLAARLVAWDARHLYEVTVGDYLDTQQIYLDHYTYRGQTIQGLLPPPGV